MRTRPNQSGWAFPLGYICFTVIQCGNRGGRRGCCLWDFCGQRRLAKLNVWRLGAGYDVGASRTNLPRATSGGGGGHYNNSIWSLDRLIWALWMGYWYIAGMRWRSMDRKRWRHSWHREITCLLLYILVVFECSMLLNAFHFFCDNYFNDQPQSPVMMITIIITNCKLCQSPAVLDSVATAWLKIG